MTDAKKAKWFSYGRNFFSYLFIVLAVLSTSESMFGIRLSKLDMELSRFDLERSELDLISISPRVLANTPQSFWLSLRVEVEAPDVSLEEIPKTKAWKTLQEKVSAYAQRLELMERQMRDIRQQELRLSVWISNLYLASAVGLVVFSALGWWSKTARAN